MKKSLLDGLGSYQNFDLSEPTISSDLFKQPLLPSVRSNDLHRLGQFYLSIPLQFLFIHTATSMEHLGEAPA
jgi:hypothetical protein